MYPSPRLALIITLLTASHSSYASSPASISPVHQTPLFDAHPFQEVVIFPDADLLNACLFKGQGRTYDICPLMEEENGVDVEMEIPGKHGELEPVHRHYRIMLGTNRVVTGPNKKLVLPWAWVYLTETGQELGPNHIPISKLTSILGPKADLVISAYQFRSPGAEFMISLMRKNEGGGANFAFICTEEEEKLEFSNQQGNVHHFVWRTPQACPVPAGEESIATAENEVGGEEETTLLSDSY